MGFPTTKDELERAIRDQTSFLEQTAAATDDKTVRDRGLALWEIGEELLRLNRIPEAAKRDQLEQAILRFDDAASVLWRFDCERHTAVYARWRQATTLSVLGRSEESVKILDRVVGEVGFELEHPDYQDLMPVVLGTWIGLLQDCGRSEAADSVADPAIARYVAGSTPTQCIMLGIAYRAKARAAEARGDTASALSLLDKAITACSAKSDEYGDELLSQLTQALASRGSILEQAARSDEALAAYEEVLARCGTASGINSGTDIAAAIAEAGKKRLKRRRMLRRLRRRTGAT